MVIFHAAARRSPVPKTPIMMKVGINASSWNEKKKKRSVETNAPIAPAAVDLAINPVAYGKALFLAKGCVTCHVNGKVGTQFSVEAGPNLTNYKVIPEYVRVWLHDPASIKPATQMPNPQLSDAEIEALIAFLSEEE